LKQPEFSPVSVPAQIAVLLALTAELFDPVPLNQMAEAELAVRKAAAEIPPEVCSRFDTTAKLNTADRAAIIQIAKQALMPFRPKAAAEKAP
jgi:F-type H+-transporting ATPase subunit alpha